MGQEIVMIQISKEELQEMIDEGIRKASSSVPPHHRYTREEAAKELKICQRQFDKLYSGERPQIKPEYEGRRIFFTREALDNYITGKTDDRKAS